MSSGYAGDIDPRAAWQLLSENPQAVLVDVRTEAEWNFVGVPDTSELGRPPVLAQWNTSSGRNSDFLAELAAAGVQPGTDQPVLFLCRSGQRSIAAAQAATAAGISQSYNITEGFEGPLDAAGHRGSAGWRASGLPWKQS
ncbi:rhodanese-like domain-containing protein [Nakamurella silvestris]|nr:rhodanese-like domain-containing protein [Nakamurella silvestris]